MRVYLAGKMTGVADYNMPLFDHVAKQLRAEGHEVYNPADLTREMFGSLEAFQFLMCQKKGTDYATERRRMLGHELLWICKYAEAIYLLPDWENSLGARAEHALAVALELEIHDVPANMMP